MGEKRQPEYILMLRIPGKSRGQKIEMFHETQWPNRPRGAMYGYEQLGDFTGIGKWRVRVNGRWFPAGKGLTFFTKTEVKEMVFRNIGVSSLLTKWRRNRKAPVT